jgi:hypothetical protein
VEVATLADKDKLEQIVREAPDGITLTEIIKRLGKTQGITSTLLSRLKSEGKVNNPETGVWIWTGTISSTPEIPKQAESPGSIMRDDIVIKEEVPIPIPGEYDKFMQIGRSLGIKEDFLKVACEHVFTGDVHNMNHVWDALNELYLRPDVTKRWYNTWSRVVNVPIPPEIAKNVLPKASEAAQEAETKAPSRFTLVGDEIVADPEGEFTFSQARQYLMTRAIQNAAPQLGGERVSEIITAITPFIETQRASRAEEAESSILVAVVKSLLESKNGNGQQQLTLSDVLAVVDKLDEARRNTAASIAAGATRQSSAFEELERMVNVFDKMKNLFAPAQSQASPVTIAVKGSDGQIGAVPLDTFFAMDNHRRQVQREDNEADDKREMGKTVRGFLDKISKAASNMVSK